MSYPQEFLYTKDHEWLSLAAADSAATIGITDFAQAELGELVFVELPQVGSSLTAGSVMCVVESTKAASDVYAPISGKVLAVNEQLRDQPDLVNKAAHTEGWLVKLQPSSSAELENLLSASDYEALTAR